jgi:hypothetical protein
MKASGPPALATWLVTKLVSGEKRESLIGDLIEQHQRGRSSAWYWRQTFSAIAISFAAEIWQHKLLAVSVAVLSASLPDIWMFSKVWVWVAKLDRLWYPHLIDSRWSWLVINPWAYRLQPYFWTVNIAWCAMLASMSWIIGRRRPPQRGLVITLLLVPQIGLRLPHLRTALTNWLQEPDNPIWFFGFLWFALFTFIAIPSSILLGGADHSLDRVNQLGGTPRR